MKDKVFISLEDKLYRTRFESDPDHSHIEVDVSICKKCEKKPCLYVCPAEVYKLDPGDEESIVVSHENCMECGTCRIVCPLDAIVWKFPDGGMGVKYRFG